MGSYLSAKPHAGQTYFRRRARCAAGSRAEFVEHLRVRLHEAHEKFRLEEAERTEVRARLREAIQFVRTDRKSTRLNSSPFLYLVCRLLLEKKDVKKTARATERVLTPHHSQHHPPLER